MGRAADSSQTPMHSDACTNSASENDECSRLPKAVDYEMLEQSMGKEGAQEILQSFVNFVGEAAEELQSAAREHDIKLIRELARELRHSCRIMGAGGLLRNAVLLEEYLINSDWQSVENCLGGLQSESQTLQRSASQL